LRAVLSIVQGKLPPLSDEAILPLDAVTSGLVVLGGQRGPHGVVRAGDCPPVASLCEATGGWTSKKKTKEGAFLFCPPVASLCEATGGWTSKKKTKTLLPQFPDD